MPTAFEKSSSKLSGSKGIAALGNYVNNSMIS
jgi:hypothetical protein